MFFYFYNIKINTLFYIIVPRIKNDGDIQNRQNNYLSYD